MYSTSSFTTVRHNCDTHRQVDIWHEVPLVPQLTGMSCWAAAAAMLVGWRECINTRPDAIAMTSGHWQAYRDGLEPDSIRSLCHHWRLQPVDTRSLNTAILIRLLNEKGPLWIGEASPGLHSIVITGLYGDGTEHGTYARVNDPWPVGRGERYSKSLRELFRDINMATKSVGRHIQVLHCGGRREMEPDSPFPLQASHYHNTFFDPYPRESRHMALRNYGDPWQSVRNTMTVEKPNYFHRRTQLAPVSQEKSAKFRPVFVFWPARMDSGFTVDFVLAELEHANQLSTRTCLKQCQLINRLINKPAIVGIVEPLTASQSNLHIDSLIQTSCSMVRMELVYWETINWLTRNTHLFNCTPNNLIGNVYTVNASTFRRQSGRSMLLM